MLLEPKNSVVESNKYLLIYLESESIDRPVKRFVTFLNLRIF